MICLLTVRQKCSIGGTVRVPVGSHEIDTTTEHALRWRTPTCDCDVYGVARRTLEAHHPFTFERPVEILSTGAFIVDRFTAQCVRKSQPGLVRNDSMRITKISELSIEALIARHFAQGEELIDLTNFGPKYTLADHLSPAKHIPRELDLDTATLCDQIGRGGQRFDFHEREKAEAAE